MPSMEREGLNGQLTGRSFYLFIDLSVCLALKSWIRIIESGQKRPLSSSGATINPTLTNSPLNHVPMRYICTSFMGSITFRDGGPTTFQGSPFQCLTTFTVKKFFPIYNLNVIKCNFDTFSPHPITCFQGKETDLHINKTSFQVVVECCNFSPKTPFLPVKHFQHPHMLITRLVL